MFTKENICKEIKELASGRITMQTTAALADLLFIKEHFAGIAGDEGTDDVHLLAWVQEMENADGTTGPHWSCHEAEVVREKYGIHCDKVKFYVALNMMYSDYCAAAEAAGTGTAELYARMAEAFLKDQDAQPDKLARYYQYIAQHG